jgi:glutathione S-transferase
MMSCLGKMFFNRVVAPVFLKRDGDLEMASAAERNEWPPIIDYLESVLPAEGYLVGGEISLADIAVASPLANLSYAGVSVNSEQHPRTRAFAERILARPSFAGLIGREKAFLEKVAA